MTRRSSRSSAMSPPAARVTPAIRLRSACRRGRRAGRRPRLVRRR
jgi:hypothetical protein